VYCLCFVELSKNVQPDEIRGHLSEKRWKGRVFCAREAGNHTNEEKGNEKKKERRGRKEKREKQCFIMATLFLAQK